MTGPTITFVVFWNEGATVYRTDLHGTVVVEAEPSGRYTVHVERGEGARPPTPAPPAATTAIPAPQPPSTACVDINTANATELQQILHIGAERAQQILTLRRQRPFGSVNELTRVNGIAAARLRDILAQGLACVR